MARAKKKAKPWVVEELGVKVRLYRRERGGTIYAELQGERERVTGDDGQPKELRAGRQSLKTSDEDAAEEIARAIARQRAAQKINGTPATPVSFGELKDLYLRKKKMTPYRERFVKRTLELFSRHLEPGSRPFRMDDFGPVQAETYITERQAGRLKLADVRASKSPRAGTMRNELQLLSAVCNWGVSFKRNGKRLLEHNPVRDVTIPKEENARRPVATSERFEKMVGVANQVDPTGQLRLMLQLAHHTGRRISSICNLRRSDVLFGGDQVRRGLAAIGWDENWAEVWTDAIRWRAEFDKKGFDSVGPINAALLAEIHAYLTRAALVGDAWLFPSLRKNGEPTKKEAADWWFGRAERMAELPHQARGGWHAFRRGWATARKAHPLQDVMMAGGWRDAKALQRVYQHADPRTVARVMEGA